VQRGGIPLGLLAGASFGTSGVWSASLLRAGWSPAAVTLVRLAGAALLLTVPALAVSRQRIRLGRKHLVYGVLGIGGCYISYVNALEHTSVGLALLLEYSGVLLVVLWTWWQGHRPGRRTAVGGALCLAGLALALDVVGTVRIDLPGLLWGLGAACGLAIYFVVSSHQDDAPPLVTAWIGTAIAAVALGTLCAVGAMPFRATTTDVRLLDSTTSWLVPLVGMTVVSSALAMTSGIAAARRLGPRLASFVGLSEVLCGIAFAWLLLGQDLTLLQCVGGLAVITGIALVRTDEQLAVLDHDDAAAHDQHRLGDGRDVDVRPAPHHEEVGAQSDGDPAPVG